MGFFSSVANIFTAAAPFLGPIAGIAAPFVSDILGGDPVGMAKTVSKGAVAIAKATGAAGNIAGSATRAGISTTTTIAADGTTEIARISVTGSLRRRTIVETFSPESGAITKREVLKGAPAVMQSDVAAANRLNRALRRLNKKQPKKLVRETEITSLKNEVVASALRRARDDCPPKCP